MIHIKLRSALVLVLFHLSLLSAFNLAAAESGTVSGAANRLQIGDYFHLGTVSEPVINPAGDRIAYTVTHENLEEDKSMSRVWTVASEGGTPIAMTSGDKSSSHPRWSPDGRFLAFLSARDDGETQVWSLYLGGGEAIQLGKTIQSVQSFEWSPDSSRILLELKDPTPEQIEAFKQGDSYEKKTPPPWVIDRKQFKTDYVGYLDRRRTHIYVMDVASKDIVQLTSGDFDDSEATWSPDGKFIAFTSNRTEDPDSNYNSDIWVVPADGKGDIRRVTSNPGADSSPAWSPDGKFIAHTSITDADAILYATPHLAVSSADGKETRILTEQIDRWVYQPRFSTDGKAIRFLLEDSGEQNLVRIAAKGKNLAVNREISGENVVSSFSQAGNGTMAVLVSRPHLPPEVFSFRDGKLAQTTFTNQKMLEGFALGEVEEVRFNSKDGTEIEGFVIKPPGFEEGRKYPVILWIHGGPQSQYDYSFNFQGQLYAANGYLVVMPNPRGSTGYGQEFCLAIWRDWGGPDFDDVMASVDDVIERGWGDPDRMIVTGWSYGGMLTNHVITKTDRFKAAATGASATLYVVNYGHDMYQRWWDTELGYPWEPEARERYERISPFNQVDKVVTPTLILGGEKDWNVPIINSEQLYLALKKRGVETELVVYPGEYHGIDTPSHRQDLYQRYLDWFGRHIQAE
jgi:dipeptidyl aminopeptidase/acylaminoacyl peptidase